MRAKSRRTPTGSNPRNAARVLRSTAELAQGTFWEAAAHPSRYPGRDSARSRGAALQADCW